MENFETVIDSMRPESDKIDMTEMDKLADGLTAKGIAFTRRPLFGGQQIVCEEWDTICHDGSYGHERGLLEVMGRIVDFAEVGDDVEGYLTAEDILSRL